MKQLRASVIVMAILAVILIFGSTLVAFGHWGNFYRSWVLIIPVIAFSLVMMISLIQYRFSLKKIGFYICHIGIMVIILSAVVSWMTTKDTSFTIPVNKNSYYSEVVQNDGTVLDFGFEISISSFEVEKYDADYRLYDSSGMFEEENVVIETVVMDRNGIYDLGKYGSILSDELKRNGQYVRSYVLENGMVLARLEQVDKGYEAVINIRDGDTQQRVIGVNDPLTYKGWKFYLMGYDEQGLTYVNLYVKRDPANIPFAIGIWLVIIGTFAECIPIGGDGLFTRVGSLFKKREGGAEK